MTKVFDTHAAIKRLAEVELLGELFCPGHNGGEQGDAACPSCERSVTVPFASLRVECPCETGMGYHEQAIPPMFECYGRGWVPEPDVEKACWRVSQNGEIFSGVEFHLFLKRWVWYNSEDEDWTAAGSREEALLRATEDWVKEQMKP